MYRIIAVTILSVVYVHAAPAAQQAELDALDETLGTVLQALNDMWDLRHIAKQNVGDDHDHGQLMNDLSSVCATKKCLPINDNAMDNLQDLGLSKQQSLEILKLVLGDDHGASNDDDDDSSDVVSQLVTIAPVTDAPKNDVAPAPTQPQVIQHNGGGLPDVVIKHAQQQVAPAPQIEQADQISTCTNPFGCRES